MTPFSLFTYSTPVYRLYPIGLISVIINYLAIITVPTKAKMLNHENNSYNYKYIKQTIQQRNNSFKYIIINERKCSWLIDGYMEIYDKHN